MIKTKKYISLLILAIAFGVSGCNPGIIDVPPPQVTDASAYFWKNSGSVTFMDSNYASKSTLLMTLSFPGVDSSGTFFINETNGTTGARFDSISSTIGSDAVSISGITGHSIVPLASGYSIKPQIISVPQDSAPPMNHIIAAPGQYVVASNNDLGIYFSSDTGWTWSKSNQTIATGNNAVTSFAILGGTIYAGTIGGDLIYSIDNGATWQHGANYRGQILAIAPVGDSGSLYISVSDSGVYYARQPNSIQIGNLLQKNTSNHQFTSLAFISDSISQTVLVGGTTGNGVFYHIGGGDWKQSSNIPSTATITSLIVASNRIYCATNNGIYYSDNGVDWSLIGSLSNAMLAFSAGTGSVLAVNSKGISQLNIYNSNKFNTAPSISHRAINDVSASYYNYYASTDSGIYRQRYNTSNWAASSAGIAIQGSKNVEVPGDIVLLRSRSGSIALDSSWQACTMYKYTFSTIPITITARIIGNLDSLAIGGKTYPNVIGVRYADESLPNFGTTPYWVIYYGKNEGPLVISQMLGTTILSKAIRLR